MAETIESFVAKLQEEGVQAGQQAADKLRDEARREAEQIVQQAKDQAEKTIADGKQAAERLMARGATELKLAARDTVLRLREALGQALSDILCHSAAETLGDPEFLADLIRQLVASYAEADLAGDKRIAINVRQELRDKLFDAALSAVGSSARDAEPKVDVTGTLKEAGFEYSVSDAKVEVTLSSVVHTLSEMVGPKLREYVQQAIGNAGADEPVEKPATESDREQPCESVSNESK